MEMTLSGVHSLVLDEANITKHKISFRAYDAQEVQLLNVTLQFDNAPHIVIKPPRLPNPEPQPGPGPEPGGK